MITAFENRCVLKDYFIVLRPIFNKTYKGENRSKNTCELYITNWSYSYKVVIVFAIYQIMISKGTSWVLTRLSWYTLTTIILCTSTWRIIVTTYYTRELSSKSIVRNYFILKAKIMKSPTQYQGYIKIMFKCE